MSSKPLAPTYYRVPSPSSSPPRVLKRTPTVSSLPPSPPSSSCGLQLPAKSHLQQALDCINREDFGTHRLLLAEFSWDDFDLFLRELSHPQNITPGRAAKLRYDYNPETNTLRIYPMPRPIHNALEDFLPKTISRLARRSTITEAEEDLIEFRYTTDISLPFRNLTPTVGRKVPGFVKQPDAYFAVRDGGMSVFPRVVFEVAFSECYDEVRADVHQWLERTHGAVQPALLFAITEHPIATPGDHDGAASDSDASSPESFHRLRATCDVDEYVGALSAFAEVNRFDRAEGGVHRVGSRTNIVSPPSESPAPAGVVLISITDIVPHIHDGRTIELDLAIYARALLNAREKMAFPRPLDRRRTSKGLQVAPAAPDPEYRPGGSRVV